MQEIDAPHPYELDLMGTWPQELWTLYSEARTGLSNGDLKPLHRYLVSGYPMSELLMQHLARMIEGHADEEFLLIAKGRKPGKSRAQIDAEEFRRIKIGLYAEKLLREGNRGDFESVILQTMGEFGVVRSTVTAALKKVRAILAEREKHWPEGMPLTAFEMLCDTWSVV